MVWNASHDLANKSPFWINFYEVQFIEPFFAAQLSEAMSRDSLVKSLPSRTWSCSTLQKGVAACAEIAGLKLQKGDMQQASLQPVHGRVQHGHALYQNI